MRWVLEIRDRGRGHFLSRPRRNLMRCFSLSRRKKNTCYCSPKGTGRRFSRTPPPRSRTPPPRSIPPKSIPKREHGNEEGAAKRSFLPNIQSREAVLVSQDDSKTTSL